MRELLIPKGRFEFKGSEVIGHRRYYDDYGNFIEEVWTKNGKHYMACLKPEDMSPESLFKLIDAELSF